MTPTAAQSVVLPPDLVSELGEAIALHLWEHDGQVLRAPAVVALLPRVAESGRGPEVEAFIRRVDAVLPDAARRDFAIAVHPVQVRSKLWLLEQLGRHCDFAASSLLVLGGWYGILPLLANWTLAPPPPEMVTIDIDAAACDAGERIVGSAYANVAFRRADAMALDYRALGLAHPPVVVNTICEHLPDLAGWWARIPRGQLVALQSNNHRGCADHVSAVSSLDEFKRQLPVSELLYAGVLPLPPWLDRYMVIGRR